MGEGDNEDRLVAAHARACERYQQTLLELMAVTDAKGINRTVIGELLKRDIETITDADVQAALRRAKDAYREVSEIAAGMSMESLTESNRRRRINDLRMKQFGGH